jgi:uncharacterized repeat protein (TIGR01451 family)
MRNTLQILLVAAALLASVAGSGAQQQTALAMTALNRTAAAEAAAGQERTTEQARPGDVLRYQLVFTNTSSSDARQVVLANPLPQGMSYVGGSIRASRDDAHAEFSIDGGQSFSAQPMEEVVVDGQRLRRPAAPERYTHVRWTIAGAVAPQAVVTAEFEARIGAPAQIPTNTASAAPNGGGR